MSMVRSIVHNRQFKPHWAMTLLAVLCIALFLRLGFWQLERAGEKKQMIAALNVFTHQKPVDWVPGHPFPGQYQPVRLQGRYMSRLLLLDNQHYQHQFGYDVVSPLELADGRVVLVDRGWIAGDINRRVLPAVDTPSGMVQLRIIYQQKYGFSGRLLKKKRMVWRLSSGLIHN